MSIKVSVYNQKAEPVGEVKLSDKIFNLKVNEALVHQAMVTQMANERQVVAHTKDRSEVRGGGRKPWRQKGTGRARAGSIRSPIWIGGGVTFGPRKDRNYRKNINRKMKQQALFMVLTDKALNKNLIILDKLEMKDFKTKVFDSMLKKLEKHLVDAIVEKKENKSVLKDKQEKQKKKAKKLKRSVLIINDKKDDKVKYSGRNLVGTEIINLNNINILSLLKYKNVIFTKKGLESLEKKHKT